MPRGLYLDADGWVMVHYGTTSAPISRERYEYNGYQPTYDQLPTEQEYHALLRRNRG